MIIKKTLLLICLFTAIGCGNLSPKIRKELNNQQGQIENLEENIGSLKLELGKQQQENTLLNSQLGNLQQGYFNLNGLQVLSGSGGLIFAFSSVILISLLYYGYNENQKNKKIIEILMTEIKNHSDSSLENKIFSAACYTDVESKFLKFYDSI